jgi:pimeloyl-ACP methyl ester carboxylesterase
VDDLEQLRSHLRLARIALLGISFGGDLAAEYTVAYPRAGRQTDPARHSPDGAADPLTLGLRVRGSRYR